MTAVDGSQGEAYRYAAFISYRHVEPDRRWAKWLHRSLEAYRVPKALRRMHGLPARVGRVFRDEEELSASSDLSREIETALRQSGHLIVICSPRTPPSQWVYQEVVRFRSLGRGDRILALLVEGEPEEAFPPALREIRRRLVHDDDGRAEEAEETEPLAADVRPSGSGVGGHARRAAKLRLLAPLLGCRYDELRRRDQERRIRRASMAVGSLVAVAAVLVGLTIYAFRQRDLAERRRVEAEEPFASSKGSTRATRAPPRRGTTWSSA